MDWRIVFLCGTILIQIGSTIPIAMYYSYMKKKSAVQDFPSGSYYTPSITVFLPVRNESKNIERRIREVIKTDYPLSLVTLIVIDSDSSDETATIAKNLLEDIGSEIKWDVIEIKRLGKSVAVNHMLRILDTDFLVMIDADAECRQKSFNLLLDWFINDEIGAVCGQFDVDTNNEDYQYRTRFNTLRTGESVVDSTPIFEGSICCFRTSSLCGRSINDKINADDSQLAMLVRSNGYRAIMDPRIKFSETNSGTTKSRRIRRGQGLVRALFQNRSLILGEGRYSVIFANAIYFYLLFPWVFLMSGAFSLAMAINLIARHSRFEFLFIPMVFTLLFVVSNTSRNLISGCLVLIQAQVKLLLGETLDKWEPERNS